MYCLINFAVERFKARYGREGIVLYCIEVATEEKLVGN